jgi:hypothetical protein
MLRRLVPLVAIAALVAAPFANAQKEPPPPKPEHYLCPDAIGGDAITCFLNAVEHLYTMCRQVKSIEIIEFGYEKSDEGVNGAKSAYCVDKHKASIVKPYQAALREAGSNRPAAEGLRGLHDLWVKSVVELKWKPGESDEQYKRRIAQPYDEFRERAGAVRTALASTAKPHPSAPAKAAKDKTAAKPAASKGAN